MARITTRMSYRWGGVLAGLTAGLIMGIMAMSVTAAQGYGFFRPLYLYSSLIWGEAALDGGVGVALVGLLIHEVIAGLWGLGFSWIAERQRSLNDTAIIAGIYGIIVWAVMTYLVAPWAMRPQFDYAMAHKGWWFVEYLVLGLGFALTPLYSAALLRGRVERSNPNDLSRAA